MSADQHLDQVTEEIRARGARPGVAPGGPGVMPAAAAPALLRLQQMGGNAMVAQLLRATGAGHASHAMLGRAGAAPGTTVQRDDAEQTPADGGAAPETSAPASQADADGGTSAATSGGSADGGSAGADGTGGSASPGGSAGGGSAGGASAGGASAGGAGGGSAGSSEVAVPPGGGDLHESGLSTEEIQAKVAEGQEGSEADVTVDASGGDYPAAAANVDTGHLGHAHGFVSGGKAGSVPICTAMLERIDPNKPQEPRAFVGGGKTGTKAWAGGGGAGPKGNQKAGSIQGQVPPEYESEWGGLLTNANAWVKPGTGTVEVKRDYLSSNAGDQGNGWYITDRAAAALEAHEAKHVHASQSAYSTHIDPLMTRIAKSKTTGRGVFYRSENARAWVQQQVGWEKTLKAFVEEDENQNNPDAYIDSMDYGSASYPRAMPGGKVAGVDYQNFLIMNNEELPT